MKNNKKRHVIAILLLSLIFLQCSCTRTSDDGEVVPESQSEVLSAVSLTPSHNQITVSWTKTPKESVTYNIYWSLTEDVSTQNNKNTVTNVTSPYVHTGLRLDKKYYYIVSEVTVSGDEHFSDVVSSKVSPIRDFPDPNLKSEILGVIGKDDGPIYQFELDVITEIDFHKKEIQNIEGIQYLTELSDLRLYDNQITDITALSGLTELTGLYLWSNQITDITGLSGLTKLSDLRLYDNQITDITALSGLTKLSILYLSNNKIIDITALSGLTKLSWLFLGKNQITDITALSGLTKLSWLYLYNNQITDITALSGLTELSWLGLYNNKITDITALSGLTKLSKLILYGNQITDFTPVNHVTDFTPVNHVVKVIK